MATRRDFVQGSLGAALGGGLIGTSLFSTSAHAEPACRAVREGAEPVDASLWACWYDLPAGQEGRFNDWLHGTHMPRLAKRPGVLWAAHYRLMPWDAPDMEEVSRGIRVKRENAPGLGFGEKWLVLAGSDGPPAFVAHTDEALDGAVSAGDREMLALRQGLRQDTYVDLVRVPGPSSRTRPTGTPPGPRIQLGSIRVKAGAEEGLWNGYFGNRLPYVAAFDGAVSVRVLRSLRGWANFGVLYEFVDDAAAARFQIEGERGAYLRGRQANPNPNALTVSIVTQAPGSPFMGARTWPAR